MRAISIKLVAASAAVVSLLLTATSGAQITPQSVSNLTPTAVSDVDYGGELISITVSQAVLPGCPQSTAYVIRDAAIIKGGLAVAMAALVAGKQLDLFLTGACDSGGNLLVGAITMH